MSGPGLWEGVHAKIAHVSEFGPAKIAQNGSRLDGLKGHVIEITWPKHFCNKILFKM